MDDVFFLFFDFFWNSCCIFKLDEELDLPSFGVRCSSGGEVAAFYAAWEAFASARSFGWEDEFRASDVCLRSPLILRGGPGLGVCGCMY